MEATGLGRMGWKLWTRPEHFASHRCAEVEEFGPAAVFLAGDASSFVTGSVLVMDGGHTLF